VLPIILRDATGHAGRYSVEDFMTDQHQFLKCMRCGRDVVENESHFDVFEQMHWLCFHMEFEHQGDPDVACAPGCPWFSINVYEARLREIGQDPGQIMLEAIEQSCRDPESYRRAHVETAG
jgi:hypothetical protein